jgi:hypothetical protein
MKKSLGMTNTGSFKWQGAPADQQYAAISKSKRSKSPLVGKNISKEVGARGEKSYKRPKDTTSFGGFVGVVAKGNTRKLQYDGSGNPVDTAVRKGPSLKAKIKQPVTPVKKVRHTVR